MTCARCHGEGQLSRKGWCAPCELAYDTWVRQHASDIIAPVLAGAVIVMGVALGLPLLGLNWLVAAGGIFAGFGTLIGLTRLNMRRRRRQFLQAPLPRAYLPDSTPS